MSSSRPRLLLFGALVAFAAFVAALVIILRGPAAATGLALELEGRDLVLVPSGSPWLSREVPGTRFEVMDGAVQRALNEEGDGDAAAAHLRDVGASAILVNVSDDPADARIGSRLSALEVVPAFRGVYLTPSEALYTFDTQIDDVLAHGNVLAEVARGILDGRTAPPIALFPEPLRGQRTVEVMVLLREDGIPRLWRSARGSSIARALVLASNVARDRWRERAQALGGPLSERLRYLRVEVSLLVDDGTLGARDPTFIDSAFTAAHGVAYERPHGWRYSLPDATRRNGDGSAVRAYEALLRENANEASLDEAQLRLYRLRVVPLGATRARANDLPDPTPPTGIDRGDDGLLPGGWAPGEALGAPSPDPSRIR